MFATAIKIYITGEWEHVFEGQKTATTCRILIDGDKDRIVAMDIKDDDNDAWRVASRDEIADVEDSLRHGNEEVFSSPEDFDLLIRDGAPAWARDRAV